MTTEEQTALIPQDVYSLMDAMDDRAIVEAVQGHISKAWVYSFQQGNATVEGLSADGVEEAARHLAKQSKGTEVIREIDCRIEFEDEVEARFVATAGRYAIFVDHERGKTHEVMLDSAVRGKRVEKIRRNGTLNDHWYEHGVTKAVRNAKRALLPEELVAAVIERARQVGRTAQVQSSAPPPPNGGSKQATRAGAGSITQAQINAIRSMLAQAFGKDEQKSIDWMEQQEPAAVVDGKVSLGALSKQQASPVIDKLKALVDGS